MGRAHVPRMVKRVVAPVIVALSIIALSAPGCDTVEGIIDVMSDRQAGESTTGCQWTEWDETESPDMYRVVGDANIEEQEDLGEVEYSEDSDGHPYVIATLTEENIEYGTRDREDISDIYPDGWTDNTQVTVTFADGITYHGYFWNRSHLLAHMLGGEDSEENLITATRCQNVGENDGDGGMQYTENIAYDYLEDGGDYIIYNVTPVYEKGDIVARSVFVDMLSDDGSIDMQVEVYNVAPGYEIDYSTGEYHAAS